MGMRRFLAGTATLSPARAYRLLRQPWKLSLAIFGPHPQEDEAALRALFPGVDESSIRSLQREFRASHAFFLQINRSMVEVRQRRARLDSWKEFLYVAMRLARPGIVIETGVFDGESSAVILLAMEAAGEGRLISVDFPAQAAVPGSTDRMRETSLPAGKAPGWVIPDSLRRRHRLELGDSRQVLPRLFEEQPTIDVFFHDSLHTFDHQLYEYSTAWEHIRAGGLLLSDDILWSAAFHRFCGRRPYVRVGGGVFGAIRKS